MEISNYKVIDKGFLKGSFNLEIPEWEQTIRKVNHFVKDGAAWISWPSEMYMKDGEKKYYSYVQFGEKTDKRLKAEALQKIKEYITTHKPQEIQKPSEWDDLSSNNLPF